MRHHLDATTSGLCKIITTICKARLEDKQPDARDGVGADIQPDAVCTDREPDAVSMDGGLLTLRNEGIDCTEPQSVRVCDISPLPQLKNNTSRIKRSAETAEVITSSPY